jgi:glyoxalase family protein
VPVSLVIHRSSRAGSVLIHHSGTIYLLQRVYQPNQPSPAMPITGLHHITLVTADARANVAFYRDLLGLRLVKKTVNFDDPSAYHLYYGNADASPGSLITFFEWKHAGRGASGVGGTHHVALRVRDEEALLKWKRYLNDRGIGTQGIRDRRYFRSLYFRDPEGQVIELATDAPGFTADGEPADALGESFQPVPDAFRSTSPRGIALADRTHPEPVPHLTDDMQLRTGMHHITATASDLEATHTFFHGHLGLRRVKQTDNFDSPGMPHHYWATGDAQPGTVVTYFEASEGARRARIGAGQTHHFALSIPTEAEQAELRERLVAAGLRVSPVMDRVYFRSIYTNDPDGHIVEVATAGPGFAVDEAADALGERLMLPPWLEAQREQIASRLTPLP